jgi:hypothetical protein
MHRHPSDGLMVLATDGPETAAPASFLSKGWSAVNDERRADAGAQPVVRLVVEDVEGVANLYIPCPACRAPIAVDRPLEALPPTLSCPACSAVLVR